MACILADKIGVITLNDLLVPGIARRWKLMGIDHSRITSVRYLDIPISESAQRKNELWDKFIETGKKQIEEEGAQALVPGCLAWMPAFELFITPDAREKLEGILGVPVIHGPALLVKFAEMMANIKMIQSKKAYPYKPVIT